MVTTVIRRFARAVCTALLVLGAPSSACAQPEPLATSASEVRASPISVEHQYLHVRAESAAGRVLIEDVFKRSPTFRGLVDRVERSTIVIYVRLGACRSRSAACLDYVGTAAALTYLRATLDHFNRSPATLAGLLAHEVYHALEVAEARVNSADEFRRFLDRNARQTTAGYETDNARVIGRRVEDELIGR